MHIDSVAKKFVIIENVEEVKDFTKKSKENNKDFFVLGSGANTIFKNQETYIDIIKLDLKNKIYNTESFEEKDIDNSKIFYINKQNNNIQSKLKNKMDKHIYLYFDANMSLSQIINFCIKNSLSGVECFAGVPSSLGGAVYGNMGCFEKSIGDIVESVDYICNGKIYRNQKINFDYRYSDLMKMKGVIITNVKLRLLSQKKELIIKKYTDCLSKKIKNQPLDKYSAGSIFKRDGDIIPAVLIEKYNLKGMGFGDAIISDKHCGFIINKSSATGNEVIKLIEFVENIIYENEGINLKREIKII